MLQIQTVVTQHLHICYKARVYATCYVSLKVRIKVKKKHITPRIVSLGSLCSTSCVMASTHSAPKQWCLYKVETINSFENWKQNRFYTLSLESNFTPFTLFRDFRETGPRAQPLRGLENDGETVPLSRRLTARQKANFLELMLSQIANYSPIISRSTLVKNFHEFIWQAI